MDFWLFESSCGARRSSNRHPRDKGLPIFKREPYGLLEVGVKWKKEAEVKGGVGEIGQPQ